MKTSQETPSQKIAASSRRIKAALDQLDKAIQEYKDQEKLNLYKNPAW